MIIDVNKVSPEESKTDFTMSDMPDSGKQANRVKELAGKALQWSEAKRMEATKKVSALDVLINNDYVYVYFEATPCSLSFAANDNDCVMQLGEADVRNMLSFLGGLYTFALGPRQL